MSGTNLAAEGESPIGLLQSTPDSILKLPDTFQTFTAYRLEKRLYICTTFVANLTDDSTVYFANSKGEVLSARFGDIIESDVKSSLLLSTPLYFYQLSSSGPKDAEANLVWEAINGASVDLTLVDSNDYSGIKNASTVDVICATFKKRGRPHLEFEIRSARPVKSTTSSWFLQYLKPFKVLEVESKKECVGSRAEITEGESKQSGLLVHIDEMWRDKNETGFYIMSDKQIARRLRDTINFDPSIP